MSVATEAGHAPILEVRDLKKHFPIRHGLTSRLAAKVHAVDGISFDVYRDRKSTRLNSSHH